MQTDLRRPIVTTKYQVSFDDAIVSNWMLKEMAGNGFHLNIVGALGMFLLANVVPRDQVDSQIPGAIKHEGEDEDGDEPGEPSPPKARRRGPWAPGAVEVAEAFSQYPQWLQCRGD